VRVGTSMFSFTDEWLARRFTLGELLTRIAELELGPGLEVIGFQTWRSYPELSPAEIAEFRRLVDGLGLEPAALGAEVDLLRRVDRPMTTAEAVDFLLPQVAVASDLGFPLLRVPTSVPAAVLEQVAPRAERAGVTVVVEVQGGQTADDVPVGALALDFSVAMTAVPEAFAEAVVRAGMSRDGVDALVERWEQGAPTGELFDAIDETDAPESARAEARGGFVRFGRQRPADWAEAVPRIAYAHSKFWDESPSVRTAELIDVLRAGGYDGVVIAEWGGNAWAELDDVDPFELVHRHHDLCLDLVSRPAAEVPA
jgi:sugar phosphate isomerase/epimerase